MPIKLIGEPARVFFSFGSEDDLHEHGGINDQIIAESKHSIVDFSSNINPLGPTKSVIRAIKKSVHQIQNYPDNNYCDLIEKIAEYNGVEPNQVLPGNGSAELFFEGVRYFNPAKTLLFKPTFSEYIRAALSVKSKIEWIETIANDDLALDIDTIVEKLRGADLLFIGNPNNPTGSRLTCEQLLYILDAASESGTKVIIDEAFLDFCGEKKTLTAARYVEKYENLIVIGSMTKMFAMPGLRLGYLISKKTVVKDMLKYRPAWMVNGIAVSAGLAALSEPGFADDTRQKINKLKKKFADNLSSAGLKVFDSETNFLLAKIQHLKISSVHLKQKMLEKGFLIRDCGSFGLGTDYIRVAVRKKRENDLFIEALSEVISDG